MRYSHHYLRRLLTPPGPLAAGLPSSTASAGDGLPAADSSAQRSRLRMQTGMPWLA